jgi:hypothetical protein
MGKKNDDFLYVKRKDWLEARVALEVMPIVLGKGLHSGVIGDITKRAIESERFTIHADGEVRGGQPLADFIEQLQEDESAAHLFQPFAKDRESADEKRESEAARIEKMTPRQKLDWANAQAAAKRRAS